MPFDEKFEAQVNDNMSNDSNLENAYDGKGKAPMSSPTCSEKQDSEFSEKKGLKIDAPPRFSTIFGPAPVSAPALPPREFESYPQPKRKSGIFIVTPVFWALLAIFLFESAALFAYTVIGLINNMPSTLVHTSVADCNCAPQPAINIAPNFLIQSAPLQETVTVTASTSTALTSSISTSSTSATFSADSTTAAAAIASQIAGILHSQSTSSTSIPPVTITVNPSAAAPTVKSTTVLTVDPSGNTLQPGPTATSTKVINESEAAALATATSASAASGTSTTSSTAVAALAMDAAPPQL